MASYIIRRIWQMVPTLIGVILLVFFLFKYFGGDPAEILGGLLVIGAVTFASIPMKRFSLKTAE